MSTATDLIQTCHSRGITLAIDGGRLTYRGPRSTIEDLLPEIRKHRDAIVEELTSQAANERGTSGAPEPPDRVPSAVSSGTEAATSADPLLVTCYTLAGGRVMVKARDAEHAEWLRRMNSPRKPRKPETITRCADPLEAVSAWLDRIGETDEDIRRETLEKARTDPKALACFLRCAREHGIEVRPPGQRPTDEDHQQRQGDGFGHPGGGRHPEQQRRGGNLVGVGAGLRQAG